MLNVCPGQHLLRSVKKTDGLAALGLFAACRFYPRTDGESPAAVTPVARLSEFAKIQRPPPSRVRAVGAAKTYAGGRFEAITSCTPRVLWVRERTSFYSDFCGNKAQEPPYTVRMHSVFSSPMPVPYDIAAPVLKLHICSITVQAGFPSPADDYMVERLDIMQLLVKHPQATFFWRVRGDSMRDAGIEDGSIIAVDRALRPKHGSIVVALVDGECTVKYLYQRAGRMKLRAANPTYPDIVPRDSQTIEVWGVVRGCLKLFVT